MLAERELWLLGPAPAAREELRELEEQDRFTLHECRRVSEVWADLIRGRTGIVIGAAEHLAADELRRLVALSGVVPVVLIQVGDGLAMGLLGDTGRSAIVRHPLHDVESLIARVRSVSRSVPSAGLQLSGTF
jgi:hypothetical protein